MKNIEPIDPCERRRLRVSTRQIILCLLLLGGTAPAETPKFRISEIYQVTEQSPLRTIIVPKVDFRDARWRDILRKLERLSLQYDPGKKGVRLFVPTHFKAEFAKIAEERFTIRLGPSVSLETVLIEMPPPGWCYFRVSEREIAVVPKSAVVNDISK